MRSVVACGRLGLCNSFINSLTYPFPTDNFCLLLLCNNSLLFKMLPSCVSLSFHINMMFEVFSLKGQACGGIHAYVFSNIASETGSLLPPWTISSWTKPSKILFVFFAFHFVFFFKPNICQAKLVFQTINCLTIPKIHIILKINFIFMQWCW